MRLLVSILILAVSPLFAATVHSGAYQEYKLSEESYPALIEFANGSQFRMKAEENYWEWKQEGLAFIAQNTDLILAHPYRVYSLNAPDQSVAAAVKSGPFISEDSLKVTYSNSYSMELSDGSYFYVYSGDQSYAVNWSEDDLVIIGLNDAWNSAEYPNILINVNLNQYIRVQLSY